MDFGYIEWNISLASGDELRKKFKLELGKNLNTESFALVFDYIVYS